jgi:hypothetical protein
MKNIIQKLTLIIILAVALPLLSNPNQLDQWQKKFDEQEKITNRTITEGYNDIAKLAFLADRTVKNPPYGMQLKTEKKDGSVIFTLLGYDYDLDTAGNMSNYTKDTLIITFKDNKVSSIERIFLTREFYTQQDIILSIKDSSPSDENHNNIEISRKENEEFMAKTTFGELPFNLVTTERIKFKNDYADYIKSLSLLLNRISFETLLVESRYKNSIMADLPSLLKR